MFKFNLMKYRSEVKKICNKLSNEWSAVYMGQLVLSELEKKLPKKLEDLDSNGQKCDFSEIRTNVRSN